MGPVLLVEPRAEWHRREMRRALAAADLDALVTDLAAIALATDAPHGLIVPGLDRTLLPAAVLVRSFPAGTFEATTRRLAVLHALVRLGVPVLNPPTAIELCVDKGATSFRLAAAGLPTPATRVVETREAAVAALNEIGAPAVLKPLFGAQGRDLRLIRTADDLLDPDAVAGVYYLQRFVGAAPGAAHFRDYRLFVVDGRVVAAMSRTSDCWITNVHQGGRPEAILADAEMQALALGATEAVGAVLAGVDLIRDGDGRLLVLEVNSMPAWSGLQSVVATDIAGEIVAAIARRTLAAPRRRSA